MLSFFVHTLYHLLFYLLVCLPTFDTSKVRDSGDRFRRIKNVFVFVGVGVVQKQ